MIVRSRPVNIRAENRKRRPARLLCHSSSAKGYICYILRTIFLAGGQSIRGGAESPYTVSSWLCSMYTGRVHLERRSPARRYQVGYSPNPSLICRTALHGKKRGCGSSSASIIATTPRSFTASSLHWRVPRLSPRQIRSATCFPIHASGICCSAISRLALAPYTAHLLTPIRPHSTPLQDAHGRSSGQRITNPVCLPQVSHHSSCASSAQTTS